MKLKNKEVEEKEELLQINMPPISKSVDASPNIVAKESSPASEEVKLV